MPENFETKSNPDYFINRTAQGIIEDYFGKKLQEANIAEKDLDASAAKLMADIPKKLLGEVVVKFRELGYSMYLDGKKSGKLISPQEANLILWLARKIETERNKEIST